MQRIVGEELFPQPWGELMNPSSGILADRLQDIDEIIVQVAV
jgi:hypothetical protein